MIPHSLLDLILIFSVPCLAGGQFYTKSFSKLTQVPRDIPSNATKIYLNNNKISNIESQAFTFHSQCAKLRLDYNKLTEIRKDMWSGLGALEYLSLEHNDIKHLAASAFADLPNLKGLYLHNNKLTTLPGNIFPSKQMLTLEILTLHENSLKRNGLGWLHELCNTGQIQEYTIRGDDVKCTSVTKPPKQLQPFKVNAYGSSVAQLKRNPQNETAGHVEVTEADTSTGDNQIVDETTITRVTDPESQYKIDLPHVPKNEAKSREYSHQDLVRWILISTGGTIILTGTAIILVLRSRALIAAKEREKRLKRIHQRQDNRPAAPIPNLWRNVHPPTTLQGLQEYQSLVDPPNYLEPSTHTNQSSDTYAVPYQHMLGRFIAFMTMYQRRRLDRRPAMPPDLISSVPSFGDTSNGYLEPSSTHHYQELNEASLLANRCLTESI